MTCDYHTEKFYDSAVCIAGARQSKMGVFTLNTTKAFERYLEGLEMVAPRT
jgi:hypothetical protein